MNVEYDVILGCPRSGTTFLVKCLQALPNSECVSGNLLPVCIPHIINHPLSPEVYEALTYGFEFALKDYLESIEKARLSALSRWLSGCMNHREFMTALQRRRKIDRIIYKEPFLSFAPEYPYHALPNSRIVHIYRDGRDVADSLIRRYNVLTDEKLTSLHSAEMLMGRKYDHRYVPWWVEEGLEAEFLSGTPYVRAIWMWKTMVRRCHKFFSQPEIQSSDRVVLLQYENLVQNPLQYGEFVVNHLDCGMNPRLRRQFRKARPNSISLYKRREAKEIEAAEQVAREELCLYGYL